MPRYLIEREIPNAAALSAEELRVIVMLATARLAHPSRPGP